MTRRQDRSKAPRRRSTNRRQQAEALYCLAEAKAATAKDEASLKDAALAYMRVVARAKTARLNSPRVPDALLKTAAIQEKLGAAKEALLLYQQVADEFKGTGRRQNAADGVARLGKSAAAHVSSALLSSKDLSTPNRRSTQRE
jgi:hypothetical protein